ncbi:RGMA protein, partial [Horornis vulcanius]|nr:RGMA protein [Horornis vulcanius]
QLTIIFKSFQECVDQKVYQAEMDELPAAFVDGSKNGGDKHGANSLKITEKVSGQHIEIQAKYIGTTIVVRQVGRYLTFAVRMPEEVVNAVEDRDSQGLYLCLRGCPLNQQIDFQAVRSAQATEGRARRKGPSLPAPPEAFTYETATAKCREKLPVEDLYFQSCVFDLLTTGDVNFMLAAYYAFEDVKMLHSNKDKLHLYERTRVLTPGNSAPTGTHPTLWVALLCLCWLCLL